VYRAAVEAADVRAKVAKIPLPAVRMVTKSGDFVNFSDEVIGFLGFLRNFTVEKTD
jgi:hypothetical protein